MSLSAAAGHPMLRQSNGLNPKTKPTDATNPIRADRNSAKLPVCFFISVVYTELRPGSHVSGCSRACAVHSIWAKQFTLQERASMSISRRVLVTGGAGLLGSHLCDRLLAQGDDVLCVDNFFS